VVKRVTDVVAQQVAFLNPAFLLRGQLSKILGPMPPQLAVQPSTAASPNENHTVPALAPGVA
jgi:hypothetical protein